MRQDAVSDVDHLLGLGLAIRHHLRAHGVERDRRHREHADEADPIITASLKLMREKNIGRSILEKEEERSTEFTGIALADY